jgi:hypothetical protein
MASKRLLFRSAAREKILSSATSLADAVCVASVLLLAEATLTEIPEEKKEKSAGHEGMD